MVSRVRIVLQARTTSSRLPAKVLLPIAGVPMAVLCAQRLGTTGHEVVIATSSDRTDDVLAHTAGNWGVRVVRGSLVDVLSRFLLCVDDLADDDIVVRATADNPLPDGCFVDSLLTLFGSAKRGYMGTSSPADGLPYGLSAEVFSVGALRHVARATADRLDREHVTSSLRRQAGPVGTVLRGSIIPADLSRLRATVDTLDDYLSMASVFADVDQPAAVDWRALLPKLPVADGSGDRVPLGWHGDQVYGAFMLGTAQLGLDYGVTNRAGRPTDAEALEILTVALRAGIAHIDTARAYGDAETRIGDLLSSLPGPRPQVVTKLPRLDSLPDDATVREVRAVIDANVYGSCRDLRCRQLGVLMFHDSADMYRWNGAAVARLSEHQSDGVIRALGVSVYSPDEAISCIADTRVTQLQIPFNLIDSRWVSGGFVRALQRRPDVRVHVRSIFLQGLLVNGPEFWPSWFDGRHEAVERIKFLVTALKRKSAVDLCLAYVRSFPWITTLVLGVETSAQLQDLVALSSEPTLAEDEVRHIQAELVGFPERLLIPSQW